MKKMSIREQVATKFETTPINLSINLLKQRITRRLCQGSGDNLVNQVNLRYCKIWSFLIGLGVDQSKSSKTFSVYAAVPARGFTCNWWLASRLAD